MTSVHRDRFLVTLSIWLLVSLAVMLLLGTFTPQGYFIISFIGLLSVMHLYAPTENGDRWWLPFRALVVVCFVAFGYVVYVRVMTVI